MFLTKVRKYDKQSLITETIVLISMKGENHDTSYRKRHALGKTKRHAY